MADELKSSLSTSGTQSVSLTPAQEELCRRLDELYDPYGLETQPSAMFRGAIFAIREAQNNPDWLAQAAHSLREIFYPCWSPRITTVPDKEDVFERFGSVCADDTSLYKELGSIYGNAMGLAHHGVDAPRLDFSNYTLPMFENLIARFETSMRRALTRQSDLDNEIDHFLSSDPSQIISDRPTR